MSYYTFITLVSLLANGRLGYAQSATATYSASESLEPCGQVSSILAEYAAASPQATIPVFLDVSLAQSCYDSVPLDVDDATNLLDVLSAYLEFQSDLAFLASPPSGYLLPGVDLLGEISNLRDQVQGGDITGEIDFETRLVTIIASAHDGHLSVRLDGLSIFGLGRTIYALVSVSDDGTSLPKVYLYEEYYNYANGTADIPSAITEIDGVPVEDAISALAQNSTNGGVQDPDAQYNSFLWSWNLGQGIGPSPGLFPGFVQQPLTPYTNLTFENGSSFNLDNIVITTRDFTGVTDGESFYAAFINATNKYAAATAIATETGIPLSTEIPEPTQTDVIQTALPSATPEATAVTQILGYPSPVVISADGALSGYFLEGDDLDDTAVLSLRFMTQQAEDSFQDSLTEFLDACRSNGKTHLVLDLIGNPGGRTSLGYDVLKQLFPTLDPYGAGNYRAHEGFEILGNFYTSLSTQVMEDQPDNYTAFEAAGGTTIFAGETYLDTDNQRFTSFEQYYGPLEAANDYGSYTNLTRYDLANPQFDESFGAIVVSGYANESNLAPQPFESENIIMLYDGQCSSTCAILSQFMKSQAKVKSIVVGGRPQEGAMQAVGGIKGSLVTTFFSLYFNVITAYQLADNDTIAQLDNSSLATIANLGEYFLLRGASGGSSPEDYSLNSRNNIAEGDDSLTPLQYIYEAADCRIWYTPPHIASISNLWADAAYQSFGLNGTTVFSGCVNGSTNQSSSLSGDSALYNDGNIQNATDVDNSGVVGSGGSGSGGGGDDNGVSSLQTPAITALIVGVAAALMI